MKKRILIMAGGTGGHVVPALVVAKQLRQYNCTIAWLGTDHGLEAKLVPAEDILLFTVNIKAIRKTGIMRTLLAPWLISCSLWQAWRIYRRFRPQIVLGMGGFAAMPGGIIAALLRIPLILHEQNAIPGFTNRFLSYFAQQVFTAFPTTIPPLKRAVYIGNPISPEIVKLLPPAQRLSRHDGALKLLILGGSRGARTLNQMLPTALVQLKEINIEVRHQCGAQHVVSTEKAYQQAGLSAEVVPFLHDMAAAYDWADIVICRAGSMTVMELATIGLAAILIPFPHAVDDHQTYNAEFLVTAGAAVLLQQQNLTAECLCKQLQALLDRDILLQMAEQGYQLTKTDAAQQLTAHLYDN